MALSGILSLWYQSEEFKDVVKVIQNTETYKLNIFGLHDSACSLFISALQSETDKPFLIITDTQDHALRTYQDINTFLNNSRNDKIDVFLFPSFDVLPYEDISPDPQIIQNRINVLKKLTSNEQNQKKTVLIADVKALLSKLISPQNFKKSSWEFKTGNTLKKDDFINILVDQKYHSVEIVEERGEFSSRGGIIDFFPIANENPIRLELFGDQIESLRYFSPSTQRSIAKINHYTLSPFYKLAKEGIPTMITALYLTIFLLIPSLFPLK